MALIYKGTTIPETTGIVKYGSTTLTKIIYAGKTVWQKMTSVTKNFGNHTYYDKHGTPDSTWRNWDVTLDYEGIISQIQLGSAGSDAKYALYARRTTSDSWTLLLNDFTASGGVTKTISNNNLFKYVRLSEAGTSRAVWEEGAGWYYYCEASNFRVSQYHY